MTRSTPPRDHARTASGALEKRNLTLGDLAELLGDAVAGQSNVMSCLMWSFENYGRLAPPKDGYAAYEDPAESVSDALLSLAEVAAAYFGFEVTTSSAKRVAVKAPGTPSKLSEEEVG